MSNCKPTKFCNTTVEQTDCTNDCPKECTFDLSPYRLHCIFLSSELDICGNTFEVGTPVSEIIDYILTQFGCTPCDDVLANLAYEIVSVSRELSYYNTLDPDYFTSSDTLINIEINDNSTLSGAALSNLIYSSFPLNASSSGITLGSTFGLTTDICARELINSPKLIWTKLLTAGNCSFEKTCTVSAIQVPYSERYNYPYRANFQINQIPIVEDPNTLPGADKGILYFNDVLYDTTSSSDGGIIRKINLNTGEVITIAGNVKAGATPFTSNDVWGDVVEYDYNSTVIADTDEIINGEPVLYFCTYGNVICRLVRERDTECDERANWKNYVIAGSNTSGNLPLLTDYANRVTGTNARFLTPYGIKRWYDVNGAPSFMIADSGNSTIKYMYYEPATGAMDDSDNWRVVNFNNLDNISGSLNIQVEDSMVVDGELRLIIMGSSQIRFVEYNSTMTPTNLSTTANYSAHNSLTLGVGHIDGSGNGVAKVYYPLAYLYRIGNTNPGYYYIVGQDLTPFTAPETKALRKIVELNNVAIGSPPSAPVDYTFSTLIGQTGTSNTGGIGPFTPIANARKIQGFFTDLKGNIYDIGAGGIRLWNFSTGEIEKVISGASSFANTTVGTVLNVDPMDTQYQLQLTC